MALIVSREFRRFSLCATISFVAAIDVDPATFGPTGLRKFVDGFSNTRLDLFKDDFVVAVAVDDVDQAETETLSSSNCKKIESATATAATGREGQLHRNTTAPGVVVFRWSCPLDFEVDATYEIHPAHFAVRKWLTVSRGKKDFTITHFTVADLEGRSPSQKVGDSHIQMNPRQTPSADIAGFLRFDNETSLIVAVGNPFGSVELTHSHSWFSNSLFSAKLSYAGKQRSSSPTTVQQSTVESDRVVLGFATRTKASYYPGFSTRTKASPSVSRLAPSHQKPTSVNIGEANSFKDLVENLFYGDSRAAGVAHGAVDTFMSRMERKKRPTIRTHVPWDESDYMWAG